MKMKYEKRKKIKKKKRNNDFLTIKYISLLHFIHLLYN